MVWFKVDKRGNVGFRARPLADDQEVHGPPFFVSTSQGDPVYPADVLAAGQSLGLVGKEIDEASLIFEQLVDKKWRFRVKDGKAVGMFLIDGTPVSWYPDRSLRLHHCEAMGLTTPKNGKAQFVPVYSSLCSSPSVDSRLGNFATRMSRLPILSLGGRDLSRGRVRKLFVAAAGTAIHLVPNRR